jgi:hypothetical protein
VAACLYDHRHSGKVKHDLLTLIRQRMFAIAQGYEDNNECAGRSQRYLAGASPVQLKP